MKYMKTVSGIMLLALFIVGCSSNASKEATTEEGITAAGDVMTVDVFMNQVEGMVGEEVKISGLVNHVCRHGGQRMFVIGEGEDSRMKITTSEDIAEFTVDLEGSEVVVTGIVEEERIDETYLTEWETEVKEGTEAHEDGIDDCTEDEATEEKMSETEKTMKRIADYRQQIEESDRGYLAFYSVKAKSFEEKE